MNIVRVVAAMLASIVLYFFSAGPVAFGAGLLSNKSKAGPIVRCIFAPYAHVDLMLRYWDVTLLKDYADLCFSLGRDIRGSIRSSPRPGSPPPDASSDVRVPEHSTLAHSPPPPSCP